MLLLPWTAVEHTCLAGNTRLQAEFAAKETTAGSTLKSKVGVFKARTASRYLEAFQMNDQSGPVIHEIWAVFSMLTPAVMRTLDSWVLALHAIIFVLTHPAMQRSLADLSSNGTIQTVNA